MKVNFGPAIVQLDDNLISSRPQAIHIVSEDQGLDRPIQVLDSEIVKFDRVRVMSKPEGLNLSSQPFQSRLSKLAAMSDFRIHSRVFNRIGSGTLALTL